MTVKDYHDYAVTALGFVGIDPYDNPDGRRCAICYGDFTPESMVSTLKCKHYYHTACIQGR
jgi:RING-like zinc finger